MTNLNFISKFYTPFILTIIAICLLLIVLRDLPLLPEARANDGAVDQHIRHQFGLVPLNPDGSVNVRIVSSDNVLEVDIHEISTYDELSVNIEELNGSSVYNALPVEIRD